LALINTNYNLLVNEINKTYDSSLLTNINNNILSIDVQIDSKINEAKNYAQTDLPNIFISSTKGILFTDLNTTRAEVISDLDAYKQYLSDKLLAEQSESNSGSLSYS